MGVENRRTARVEVRLSAELQVDGKTVTGQTRDLSAGGVCVEIDRPLAERSQVRVTLFVVENGVEAEGVRGLELIGTVQWSAESERGHAIGIKFGALTATQSTMLANALKTIGGG